MILDLAQEIQTIPEVKSGRRRTAIRRRPQGARWKNRIIGVDGEGWGCTIHGAICPNRDEFPEIEHGPQIYRVMVAGDNHGNEWILKEREPDYGLRTEEIFEWLYTLPDDGLITSYSFGYDVAHILIDLSLKKLTELFHRNERTNWKKWGKRPVQWYKYWLDWIPKKQFMIRVPTRTITIWDAYPWFQASFLNACKDAKKNGVPLFTPEELKPIELGKLRRGDDAPHEMGEEIAYALAEMHALAKLMYQLIETFESAGVKLQSFYGPGSAAAVYLKRYNVSEKMQVPTVVNNYAQAAYIGGRFEQTGHGYQKRLYEYDINSAYPHGAANLPCFAHGEWTFTTEPTDSPYALVHVEWQVDREKSGGWGPFPVRNKHLMPHWPYTGKAWIWKWEYEAGRKIPGVYIHDIEWANWEPFCSHKPFEYVPELFQERQALQLVNDGREQVNKLVLNSSYGKVGQNVGTAPYYSPAFAGGITSYCRSQLLSAIALNPTAVIATATDAIMSTEPLDLDIGKGLGQWGGPLIHDDCLLIQPGFYTARKTVDPDKPNKYKDKGKSRSRGIPQSSINWELFWDRWEQMKTNYPYPDTDLWLVPFKVQYFNGVGLTVCFQDHSRLGRWEKSTYQIGFHSIKRPEKYWDDPNWITTDPVWERTHKPYKYKPGIWQTEFMEQNALEIDQDFPWLYDDEDG